MAQTHQPMNESAQKVNRQRYSHQIMCRHDFTPGIGELRPVYALEMFPTRHVSYNVKNVLQLMPLAGDCKQDMYMYTESIFCAWHSVWSKWSLFRYGKLNPSSAVQVPTQVPYFTLQMVLLAADRAGVNGADICPWLKPGSVLDSLYGICSLLRAQGSNTPATATLDELHNLPSTVKTQPFNALYLRAYYHHWLINHTNEWLNKSRGNMVNDEYPFRNDDAISLAELDQILNDVQPWNQDQVKEFPPVLHERDYFTAANPLPQKGAAQQISGVTTVQDLTKIIHQQEIMEKDADAGTSHYEAILSRYGVAPRSLGVMRPVSAGNPTRQVISINPIFNQAGDTVAPSSGGLSGVNFQGDISGRGFSADGSHHVEYTADVDGCILTCIFIRPETVYHQGVHRMFARLQRNDFIEPAMINDGDEPIYSDELYLGIKDSERIPSNVDIHDKEVFGYRNKYLDYIYMPSRVSGEFHTTMKHWSLHRDFAGRPKLNDTFVRCFDTPTRIFSYEGQPARSGYPRFICYMQFEGIMHDCIPNYTKREI